MRGFYEGSVANFGIKHLENRLTTLSWFCLTLPMGCWCFSLAQLSLQYFLGWFKNGCKPEETSLWVASFGNQ